MEAESIEIEPSQISLSIDELTSKFIIQNLTLHYIQIQIISPNSDLLTISPSNALIDPCEQVIISVSLNIWTQANLQSFEYNKNLIVLSYDVEDFDEYDPSLFQWDKLSKEQIAKHKVQIQYVKPDSQLYTIKPSQPNPEQIIVAKKLNNDEPLSEDQKKVIIQHCFTSIATTEQYRTTKEFIIFFFPSSTNRLISFENDVIILAGNNGQESLIIKLYIPQAMINTVPKYPQEPASPQGLKFRKKVQKSSSFVTPPFSSPDKVDEKISPSISRRDIEKNTQKQFIQQQIVSQIQTNLDQAQVENQDNSSKFERNTRKYQSEIVEPHNDDIIRDKPISQNKNWNNFQPKNKDEGLGMSPVIFLNQLEQEISSDPSSINQSNSQFKEVCSLPTYSQIKLVLLLSNTTKLLTLNEKDVIKVWDIQMNSEVGQIWDHKNLKNGTVLFLKEWRYPDEHADDQTFQDDDGEVIFSENNREERVFTIAQDNMLRIFNLSLMKLEQTIKLGIKYITASTFLTDKLLFCVGGRQESEFSVLSLRSKKPKFKSLKFFRLDTLKEYKSFKLQSDEDDVLTYLEYADNHGELKHSRLNHVLAVSICGKENIGRLTFLFLDGLNQCTILMTLNCEQLNIKGIQSIIYILETGRFAIVETVKKYEIQKVIVVNIKQVVTEQGIFSGIECKQIDQTVVGSHLSMQVMDNPQRILIAQKNKISFYDLNTQFHDKTLNFSDDIDSFYTFKNRLAIIISDTVKIIDI